MDWRKSLEGYLAAQLPSATSVEISRYGALPGGASNETVAIDLHVTAAEHGHTIPLVLRPERKSGVLAPYDVVRQFRVMRALAATHVPVPAVAWLESTGGVLGAPFFLMSRLEGDTLPLFWYGGETPRLRGVASALASVHAVDWHGASLDFLAPRGAGSPLERDLAPWDERYRLAHLDAHPVSSALRAFLTRNAPADMRTAFLHGDPNPGNYLFQGDAVAAVLDWELAALGDPRSDLGFYAALVAVFAGPPPDRGRTVLSDAYYHVTGTPLRDLDYFEALGLYKIGLVFARMPWGYGRAHAMDVIAARLVQLFGPRWAA